MSQAHYRRCSWFIEPWECPDIVVAVLTVRGQRGLPWRPMCKTHLDAWLDWADGDGLGPMRPEPAHIEWTWDAGTRTCPIHHWPAVLCEGWSDEHRTLIKRGTDSYSDLARRLLTEHRA